MILLEINQIRSLFWSKPTIPLRIKVKVLTKRPTKHYYLALC